jgi:Tfp pilus assembly protein PilO
MRLFLPLILIIAALGLFIVYTNPTYQADQGLQTQVASYDDALNKSQELLATRNQLLAKRNTFSTTDVNNLEEILPDNVDNIRLIIDVNNIASRHSLALQDVQLGSVSSASTGNTLAAGAQNGPVGSVDIGFSVTTSYANMLAFLQDLEHSLRLIDVEDLDFTVGQNDNTTYVFTIQTYWLY